MFGPPVTAVIIHYRGRAELASCVESCLAEALIGETVVVDNEGVGEQLRREHPDPSVRILHAPRNVGYGRAANAGLSVARGEAALVLNQDAVLSPDAVGHMLLAADRSGAWVVGPRLGTPRGTASLPKERFPPPLSWERPVGTGAGWRYVPWVPGAAMLFAPGHLDLRFDERLFMYVEDEELCWRVWEHGGRVVLAEEAEVGHTGGTASGARWSLTGIAARTVVNRTRMVRWHAGTAAATQFVAGALWRAVARRSRDLAPAR